MNRSAGFRATRAIALGLAMVLAIPAVVGAGNHHADSAELLSADLESVRQDLGIPGMAAAVAHDGQVVWAQGFGFADLENGAAATPHTPFGLASVTKPIAATVVMQLVEEGLVDLDAPIAEYGVTMPDTGGVTVRHLLNHTSEGTPGTSHNYNGNRYAYLEGVMEGATGKSFAQLLAERITAPVGMTDTAVNPLDAWSGVSVGGLAVVNRVLGRGEGFDHYPDVYARLAEPYQFDDEYSIVPGMYHLTHSPAAGGISSAADLVLFDIALENLDLVGESAYEEMFTSSVPTVPGRTDLTYALGWYVQDFEGVQLIWHAGRWPPSTSALYVKVPEFDLTFIVLANTDNLTVPFPGIGNGDLSRSLPALTFIHHFVFPAQHGQSLPTIDWSAPQAELTDQLGAVESEAGRVMLERELWSRRQALASSGQFDRADALAGAARSAFPGSPMRLDEATVSTVGKMPYIAPVTSARRLVTQTRLIVGWLAVVALSLAALAVHMLVVRGTSIWDSVMWLLATLLLGPVALAAYWRAQRSGGVASEALCGALFRVAGYAVGWAIAIALLLAGGEDPAPLLVLGSTILIPYVIGLIGVTAPMLRMAGAGPLRRGAMGELVTWGVSFAAFLPLTFLVDNRWLSTIPAPSSPYFGAMMTLIAVSAVIVLIPTNLLLRRRGFVIWASRIQAEPDGEGRALPTFRESWWLVSGALFVMLLGIVLAVGSSD